MCIYIYHTFYLVAQKYYFAHKKRHKYRNSAQSRSEVCTGRRELIFYKGSVLTAAAVTLVDGFRDAVLQRGFYHVGHLTVTIRKLKHLTLSAYRTLCENLNITDQPMLCSSSVWSVFLPTCSCVIWTVGRLLIFSLSAGGGPVFSN